MDFEIECLKCGSYIHDADHCWNWKERRWCAIFKQLRESCDCDKCKTKEICQYCNNWKTICRCYDDRCLKCNEHFVISNNQGEKEIICRWIHSKLPCKFCKLPISYGHDCENFHFPNKSLCKECNMPKQYEGQHEHDNTLCKKCGTLLNYGKCIYLCVNGGNQCIHCYRESVVNNWCWSCTKYQNGFLTKTAIK